MILNHLTGSGKETAMKGKKKADRGKRLFHILDKL